MKYFFIALLMIAGIIPGCRKKQICLVKATITKSGTPCAAWGINVGSVYPSANIPDEFKHEGLLVCVRYELYEDMRLCACCGGTWANIKSMKVPPD